MGAEDPTSFAEVKTRLDEIVQAVSDEALSLDDALALYEEAVSLGLKASDLIESNIAPSEELALSDADGASDVEGASDRTERAGAAGDIA